MASQSAVVCAVLFTIVAVSATDVHQCPGRSIDNLSNKVQLNPCKKLPCKLKKNTRQDIFIAFTPENDTKDLKNSVSAEVFGVPLPFVGVDGSSVCDKIFTESGEKTACPLKAGTTYTYKDSFPILEFYPSINVNVKWSLKDPKEREIVCFKVPAKIVN